MIPALGGQGRQVAPGDVAVDSLIEAAKLVGALQPENPPPTPLGLGGLAPVPMQYRLAMPQLGILGVELQTLAARGKGKGDIAIFLSGLDNLGKGYSSLPLFWVEVSRHEPLDRAREVT